MSNITSRLDDLHHRQSLTELGGGADRIAQQHKKGKLTARERLDLLLDADSFVELDRFVTHRATEFGIDAHRPPGRRRGDRVGPGRWPAGIRVRPGLHSLWWLSVGDARRKDLQGHGTCRAQRSASDRAQRFRRRAHPGRGGVPRRLRRHLPPQYPRVRRGAPDFGHSRPLRWRRGVHLPPSPTSCSWCVASATCS